MSISPQIVEELENIGASVQTDSAYEMEYVVSRAIIESMVRMELCTTGGLRHVCQSLATEFRKLAQESSSLDRGLHFSIAANIAIEIGDRIIASIGKG